MLDIALERVAFSRPGSSFNLSPLTCRFERSQVTAVIGPCGSGKSTLLDLISGELRPASGVIRFGSRDVSALPAARRPLLAIGAEPRFPSRWSVEHVLIAALRRRGLSRPERLKALDETAAEWELTLLRSRAFGSLSDGEKLQVRLAEVDALRPAILVARGLFGSGDPGRQRELADRFYRFLRTAGVTAVIEPSLGLELGHCGEMLVLEEGRVVQSGTPHEVHAHPRSLAAAVSTGSCSLIPVRVEGQSVDSPLGRWANPAPPFQGKGEAVVRPGAFTLAARGEESDVLLAVEEASFEEGRWRVTSIISGGRKIVFDLPSSVALHKGKLLPLRFEGSALALLRIR